MALLLAEAPRQRVNVLAYTLIATIIVLSLTLAPGIFLPEYLLYRYDHDDQMEAGEK